MFSPTQVIQSLPSCSSQRLLIWSKSSHFCIPTSTKLSLLHTHLVCFYYYLLQSVFPSHESLKHGNILPSFLFKPSLASVWLPPKPFSIRPASPPTLPPSFIVSLLFTCVKGQGVKWGSSKGAVAPSLGLLNLHTAEKNSRMYQKQGTRKLI